jgi:Fe-S cluster biogenesis protein NfuA
MTANPMANSVAIQIRGEPQADPDVCRFVVDREVFPGGSFACSNRERAQGSPFLESLFAIEGVTQAWVAGPVVTVQKSNSEQWPVVGKLIGAAIRAHLATGARFSPPASTLNAKLPADAPARIQHILETQINPGVAGHGGKIELIEVRGTAVYLKMSGGCQGCGSAQVTLKQGVEKALCAQIPEITEIVDVTDHASGEKPYFQ